MEKEPYPALTWQHVALAALAAIPGIITGLAAYNEASDSRAAALAALSQGKAIEIKVDGRLTQLLEISTRAAADAATLRERDEQRLRDAEKHTTTSSNPKK